MQQDAVFSPLFPRLPINFLTRASRGNPLTLKTIGQVRRLRHSASCGQSGIQNPGMEFGEEIRRAAGSVHRDWHVSATCFTILTWKTYCCRTAEAPPCGVASTVVHVAFPVSSTSWPTRGLSFLLAPERRCRVPVPSMTEYKPSSFWRQPEIVARLPASWPAVAVDRPCSACVQLAQSINSKASVGVLYTKNPLGEVQTAFLL